MTGKLDDEDRARTAAPARPCRVLLLDSHWITRTALHTALAGAGDLEIAAANCFSARP